MSRKINQNLTTKKAFSNVYKHEINPEIVILAKKNLLKGQKKSKWFFQVDVSSKKTNECILIYYYKTSDQGDISKLSNL